VSVGAHHNENFQWNYWSLKPTDISSNRQSYANRRTVYGLGQPEKNEEAPPTGHSGSNDPGTTSLLLRTPDCMAKWYTHEDERLPAQLSDVEVREVSLKKDNEGKVKSSKSEEKGQRK